MRHTLFFCLLLGAASSSVWAQAGVGSAAVTGAVLELPADGIPDCIVTLTNTSLGLKRVMNTSDDGEFDAPALTPATGYHLNVTRKGFVDWDSADFDLSVGQTLDFRVTLKHTEGYTGDESNIPPVRIEEPRNGVNTLVSRREVENLPSPNRRLDPLVGTDPFAGVDHRNGRLVLAGQEQNLAITDGVVASNTYFAAQRGGIANQLTLDSTQEFQVLTTNYPPVFGMAMGGVVNAVTHSGTNDLHLAGYGYFMPNSIASNYRFAPGQNLFDHQTKAGGSGGAAVIPDRIFFFGNVDYLDGKGSGYNRITSPLLTDAAGNTVPAANCKATAAQCAAAIKFIQGQMNVITPLTDHFVSGLAKVDYRRSDRNTFDFAGNVLNAESPNGGPISQVAPNNGLLGLVNSTDDVRYGKASWISVPTRSTLNEVRLGFFDDKISNPAFTPSITNPQVAVNLYGVNIGNARPNSSSLEEMRYQVTDNFTATTNTHSFNVGGELWRSRDTVTSLNAAQYTYPTLTAFATDFGGGGSGKNYTLMTEQLGASRRGIPDKQWNAWAFDTWRPVRRLTVVAGVRFEKPGLPSPQWVNSSYYQTGTLTSPNIDFAPRVSLAYRWSDKTVIRAGYGWFYEPMPGELLDSLYWTGNGVNVTSLNIQPAMTNAPLFPRNALSTSIPAGSPSLMWASAKLRNPAVRDLNVAIERHLNVNTTLTLTGLHSRGYGLYAVSDQNLATPLYTSSRVYSIQNAAGQQVGSYYTDMYTVKNDPKFSHLYVVQNGGSSWYDAASLELRHRLSQGLTVQASYTYSRATGDTFGPTIAGVLSLSTYNGNTGGDRGLAPFDNQQRGSITWTYTPEYKWLKGFALSGIATLATAQHETPTVWVSGQEFSSITMVYPTSLNGWGGWSRLTTQQIGSLPLSPQRTVDARLSRTFTISDRVKAMVLFEAFNALNNQFTTAVNTVGYIASATAPPNGAVNGPTTGVLKPVSGIGAPIAASAARTGQIGLRLTF
jgi:Carboxypeptidase regulatory-like domain